MADHRLLRWVPRAAGAALAGLLAGCYTKHEQGGSSTYAVALWVPALVALSGLAFLAAGWLTFRRRHKGLGVLLMIVGPVLLVCVPPMMILNRVVLDDNHLEVVDCFLWKIERQDVAFDDVQEARLDVQKTQTRAAGEVKKYTLELTLRSGPPQSVVVKNALKAAWPEVARRLRARGFKNLPEGLPQ